MIALRKLLVVATLLTFPTAALAYWQVQSSDEDVFGNVNVTATSVGDNGSIVRFECGSGKEPFVALLLRSGEGDIPETPAYFLVKTEAEGIVKVDASLGPWNDTYVAIKTSDAAFLRSLANAMISAKKSIAIGGEVPLIELKISDTFSSRGSTAAGETVLRSCLGQPTAN